MGRSLIGRTVVFDTINVGSSPAGPKLPKTSKGPIV